MENCHAVIMAGGSGTRLWPLSTESRPKQFLDVINNESFLNQTIKRLTNNFRLEDIYVISNIKYSNILGNEIYKGFNKDNIIYEPIAKNTAACIVYAAIKLKKRYGNGIMCIFPSDHYIENTEKFKKDVETAIELASETKKIVLIGVQPTSPATGYGYIKKGNIAGQENYFKVESFIEKPRYEVAEEYLEDGRYLWNTGIYIFLIDTLLEYSKQFIPEIYDRIKTCERYFDTSYELEKLTNVYEEIPKISIDYAVMTKVKDAFCINSDFYWNDVGTWESLVQFMPHDQNGNVIIKSSYLIGNSYSNSSEKRVTIEDINNLIVIETADEIFIKKMK